MNFWLITIIASLASQFGAKEAEAEAGEKPGFIRISINIGGVHAVCEQLYQE